MIIIQNVSNMKNVILIVLFISFLSGCDNSAKKSDASEHEHHQTNIEETKVKSKSPKSMAMATLGENHIHIDYSSPSVRGRVIYGGLVAYGAVWSTGAHKATSVEFQQAVIINETTIPAGKYGFFTIPGQEKWTIILSKDWDMHLADEYRPENDVIRFEVTPEKLNDPAESLMYEVKETSPDIGRFSMSWADVKVSFDIKSVK
jgi:hypothetical protein